MILRFVALSVTLGAAASACTFLACTSKSEPLATSDGGTTVHAPSETTVDASATARPDPIGAACARWTGERDNGWSILETLLAGGRQLPQLVSDPRMMVLSPEDLRRVTEARQLECVHVVTRPGSNITGRWLEVCHDALVGGADIRVCALPTGSLAVGEKVSAFWQCASMTLAFDAYGPDGPRCGTSPGLGGACPGVGQGFPSGGVRLPDCGYGLQCENHMFCPPRMACQPGAVPNTCVAAPELAIAPRGPFDAGPPPPPPPPPDVVKLGEPCRGAQCEPGSYCRWVAGDPVPRCVPRLPAGASCADEPPESCVESAYCEYCGGNGMGGCTPPTPTCIALSPLGGPCTYDSQCGSRENPTLRCEPTCKPGQENACVVSTEDDARLLAPGEIGPSVAQCVYGGQALRNPCEPCPRIVGHGEACDLNAKVDACTYLGMQCGASRCVFAWE